MIYTASEIRDTEDEIKRYFRHMAEIERLKKRLKFLTTRKQQIENDIENSNIRLRVTMSGIAFDNESIQSLASKSSLQEKALDSAFIKLERQLYNISNEILDINIDIRDIECQNCDIEFLLDSLEPTAKEFVYLYYKKRLGYTKISNILHLSVATLSRLRIKILSNIRGYDFFMKRK